MALILRLRDLLDRWKLFLAKANEGLHVDLENLGNKLRGISLII